MINMAKDQTSIAADTGSNGGVDDGGLQGAVAQVHEARQHRGAISFLYTRMLLPFNSGFSWCNCLLHYVCDFFQGPPLFGVSVDGQFGVLRFLSH